MTYNPDKKLKGDMRGYTRYCGEMQYWTDNVEHVAFLGKLKLRCYTTACAATASLCATIESDRR